MFFDWIIYHCFLFYSVFLYLDRSLLNQLVNYVSGQQPHLVCIITVWISHTQNLNFSWEVIYFVCGRCVVVCLRRSEDNTESCFSPFTFPLIPGIKLKSLGGYNKHLTRPCYTDLKLCLWNTSQPFTQWKLHVCQEKWSVEEESKHKNLLHKQSAWAVKFRHYSTELKTDQSTKQQTASMILETVAIFQQNTWGVS